MTVTAIHPPSKVLDLDAGIRSAAVLTGAGLVGMISAGPAKLALVPIAGGGGPVIDLTIDSPQDLALLSKDVAVVRAGDGSLWAISDLAGAPRAKLVGRDVRALAMRPQGESALALYQDGGAGAITLSKQEVAARTFGVRGGMLRACSVGENVTWVVVDGEGGGLLRIHPGATPELGTSAKTVLPAEARELDQVRGGATLSAVFKRGFQSICLVIGNPNKLASKMVEVDGKPADVAVIDDALVVAFADGRVALYDAAAIADGGMLRATFAISPPARGKPRVAVVAGTAKIPASLWIGTTSGEILHAAFARGGEKVEVPPPSKSAAPQSAAPQSAAPQSAAPQSAAPRAEVAALKQALAEAEAARDTEAARARAFEETLAAAGRASDEERAAHAATIEALRTEKASEIEVVRVEYAQVIEAIKVEHVQWIDAHKIEQTAAVEAVKAEHRAVLEADRLAHASAIQALKDEHAKAIEARCAEHAAALEAQKAEHAQAVDAMKAEHAKVIDSQKAEHDAAAAARDEAHGRAISEKETGASARLSEMEAAAAAASAERDTLRGEIEAAKAEIAALSARALAAEQDAAAKGRERDEVASGLDALRTELAEERAKLDKDFVKWGEMTISLDRARGALDAMMSRAQGVFGKRRGE